MNFKQSDYQQHLPNIQMIPLIDILLVNLSFFMSMFLYFNFESQLNIAVPKAASSKESQANSETFVINVARDGAVVVNQKKISLNELAALLGKTSKLYPGQAVILRADEKTYHERVISVLDVCAKANIWNISFATSKEK